MAISIIKGAVTLYSVTVNTVICNVNGHVGIEWQTDVNADVWIPIGPREYLMLLPNKTLYLRNLKENSVLAEASDVTIDDNQLITVATILGEPGDGGPGDGGDPEPEDPPEKTITLTIIGDNSSRRQMIDNEKTAWEFTSTSVDLKLTDVIHMDSSYDSTGYITSNRHLWMRGRNQYGQLGLGHNNVVVEEAYDTGILVRDVIATGGGMAYITLDNTLFISGIYDLSGEDVPTYRTSPIEVMSNVKTMSRGLRLMYILTLDGKLFISGNSHNYGLRETGPISFADGFIEVASDVKYFKYDYEDDLLLVVKNDDRLWSTFSGILTDSGLNVKAIGLTGSVANVVTTTGEIWSIGTGPINNGHNRILPGDTLYTWTNTGETADDLWQEWGYVIVSRNGGELWGKGNSSRQLGLGGDHLISTLTNLNITAKYVLIDDTFVDPAIVGMDDHVYTCGRNDYNQSMLNHTDNISTWTDTGYLYNPIDPIPIVATPGPIEPITNLYGSQTSFIIKPDDTLWFAGDASRGAPGAGASTGWQAEYFTHTYVTDNVKKVYSGGSENTFILKHDGTVWATGDNFTGGLGIGFVSTLDVVTTFTPIVFENDEIVIVKDIIRHRDLCMIISTDNKLYGTGQNGYGQLGLGAGAPENIGTFTHLMDDVAEVTVNGYGTMVRKLNGSLWSTGYGYHGTLGLGEVTVVKNFTDTGKVAKKLCQSSGYINSYIDDDDYLWVTGGNSHYTIGLGENNMVNTFTRLDIQVKDVYMGANRSYIITLDDRLLSAGSNYDATSYNSWTSTHVKVFTDLGIKARRFTQYENAVLNGIIECYNNDGTYYAYIRYEIIPITIDIPTFLQPLTNVSSRYAISEDNNVWYKGPNNKGEVGIGVSGDILDWTPINFRLTER